jgi:tetratricopeptide (TPR) repeat protein
MGEVFLAWDERLSRRVAVKRIPKGDSTPRDRERLRREARAAARVSHPAVVQVYDLVEDAGGDAIVLEYVEGRTLRALLADGVPPIGDTVRWAREIAEGLASAHAAGLVHRDLKAENVLVTREGQTKILDFGIAKAADAKTLTPQGWVVGTAHAMSPEQARGGEVDARSDLFSLGVLLYELLTGVSPFRGSNALDELQRVVSLAPPPVSRLRPEIPGALSGLVDRLLAKRPEDRPGSAAEVARALAALAAPPAPADAPDFATGTASTLGGPAVAFISPAGEVRRSATFQLSRRLAFLLLILLAILVFSIWLLQRRPPNVEARASLELLEGDPRRAEQIYLDILRRRPQRDAAVNLGLARSLLGRPADAVEAFRLALRFGADDPDLLLHLADAELASGHTSEARKIYGRILEIASPQQRMIRAQCLAHLGRFQEAVQVTQQALRESGEQPEILYAAALVYALTGDRAAALINVEAALKKGMQPRWFTLPAFGSLRDDPILESLLRRSARSATL